MTQWYYADTANERQGPVSADALRALFGEQRLGAASLIWREGLAGWQPLSMFAGELGLEAEAANHVGEETIAATEEDVPLAPEPSADAYSPYAAPQATVASVERIVLGGDIVYAGFWKRAAAQVIDLSLSWFLGSIVGAVVGVLAMAVLSSADLGLQTMFVYQGLSWIVTLGVGAMYYGWFHCSGAQATLGKMAVGIKVVRGDGQRVGFWRAIGRYFGLVLSLLLVCAGVVMAAFTPRKRALHDLLCDTLVVDRWAYTAHPQWQRRGLGAVSWVLLALSGLALLLLVGLVVFIGGGFGG